MSTDVILKKLEYYREGGSQKHLRDIQGILANISIEEAYLGEWISKLRLERQWAELNQVIF